jgi:hypothetical protein
MPNRGMTHLLMSIGYWCDERLLAMTARHGKSWHSPSRTPSRNVRGITAPQFDGAGTADIKAWLRYWVAVRDGRQPPNSGDEAMDPATEIGMLEAELEARKR